MNSRYKIFDGDKYQSFDGLLIQEKELFEIVFELDMIEATADHRLLTIENEWVHVKDLSKDHTILGAGQFISKKAIGIEKVYDPINVGESNRYQSNKSISHNCALVYLDECAFVENFQEFWSSTYPTISSGDTTKLLFTSTPKGLNHFYKFVVDAKENRNGFAWAEVKWDRVPGRDEKWKEETLQALSFNYEQFAQEYECEFMGSSGTLIAGSALKSLVHHTPIYDWDGFSQYQAPVEKHSYVMTCDVSRGKGLDYSAFQVIDVTSMPYVQVATFRSNTITPTDYAHVINKIGTLYNTAAVLVENNDIGGQVADMLFDDLDYDNLLFTEANGKSGKVLCGGGSKAEPSIRTTTSVKAKGCSVLKLLVEQQQIIINDFNTINELSHFSKKGKSYEADDGHDDMVMCLVLFAWCTTNPYFSNLTDINTLNNLRDNASNWDDCIPFGFIVDGREDDDGPIIADDQVWMKTDAWSMNY